MSASFACLLPSKGLRYLIEFPRFVYTCCLESTQKEANESSKIFHEFYSQFSERISLNFRVLPQPSACMIGVPSKVSGGSTSSTFSMNGTSGWFVAIASGSSTNRSRKRRKIEEQETCVNFILRKSTFDWKSNFCSFLHRETDCSSFMASRQ